MSNEYFQLKRHIQSEIKKIPKKNRQKFLEDYLMLIKFAQREDYEDFDF